MRIGIVGVGLIGASIGAAAVRSGHEVLGWDASPEAARIAAERGAVTGTAGSLEELLASGPDLVVVAAPPAATVEIVGRLPEDVLAMDVAGVKAPVAAAAVGRRFVATHPMAGRERSGPASASPVLFRGAAWIVASDVGSPQDRAVVTELIRELGANPVEMTVAEHDRAVALVSHLPQLLAASLAGLAIDDPDAAALAAGSFRDLTRVASSDPDPWSELLVANREELARAVDRLVARLTSLEAAAAAEDRTTLLAELTAAKTARDAMAPAVVPVRVALADRPGELAKVGRALASTGVDVRDLQLRHAPFGGGGLLTIAVRLGEAAPLRDALVAEGLELSEPV